MFHTRTAQCRAVGSRDLSEVAQNSEPFPIGFSSERETFLQAISPVCPMTPTMVATHDLRHEEDLLILPTLGRVLLLLHLFPGAWRNYADTPHHTGS